MRDVRDPQALGTRILDYRKQHPKGKLSRVVDRIPTASVPDFDGSGPMSNDPAQHHSKTPFSIEPMGEPGGD